MTAAELVAKQLFPEGGYLVTGNRLVKAPRVLAEGELDAAMEEAQAILDAASAARAALSEWFYGLSPGVRALFEPARVAIVDALESGDQPLALSILETYPLLESLETLRAEALQRLEE